MMTRSLSLLRGILLAVAAHFAVFCAPIAVAATITLTDNNCASYTLSGTPGNQTLVCVPSTSSVPVCSVTGGSSAVVGSISTLTASCSGSPTSYLWTGGNCATQTGSTCPATSSSTGTVSYTVTATNTNGTGSPSPSKSLNWTSASAPVCTLSASPSTVPSGGANVTLTATCTNSPTSWTWTGGFAAGTTNVNSQVVTTTPGTTFTVAGTNSAGGTGPTASVTVGQSSGGPTGSVAINSCPGYTASQTKVMDVVIPTEGMNRYYVTTPGAFRDGKSLGFYPDDVMVVVFKAPPADPSWLVTFVQSGAGDLGPVATRTIVLSRKPCDFGYPTKSADAIWATEASGMSLNLASGTEPSPYSRYLLVPGQEYYVNIRNKTSSGGGCSSTRCDIIVSTNN